MQDNEQLLKLFFSVTVYTDKQKTYSRRYDTLFSYTVVITEYLNGSYDFSFHRTGLSSTIYANNGITLDKVVQLLTVLF